MNHTKKMYFNFYLINNSTFLIVIWYHTEFNDKFSQCKNNMTVAMKAFVKNHLQNCFEWWSSCCKRSLSWRSVNKIHNDTYIAVRFEKSGGQENIKQMRTNHRPINKMIRGLKWMWIGYALWKPHKDLARQTLDLNPAVKRNSGRPKQMCQKGVKEE